MIDDVVGAQLFTHAIDCGREAVAITVRFEILASWMPIEPTPPAPPMISIDLPGWTFMRSWNASQAVIEVSGIAAACAKSSFFGLRPTMRSSTRWNSLLQPARVTSPA